MVRGAMRHEIVYTESLMGWFYGHKFFTKNFSKSKSRQKWDLVGLKDCVTLRARKPKIKDSCQKRKNPINLKRDLKEAAAIEAVVQSAASSGVL